MWFGHLVLSPRCAYDSLSTSIKSTKGVIGSSGLNKSLDLA